MIDVGGSALNLSRLPQLVNDSQTRAIVSALLFLTSQQPGSLAESLRRLDDILDRDGLSALIRNDASDYLLARPRSLEVGMAINRLVSRFLRANVKNLSLMIMSAAQRSISLRYEDTVEVEM